MPNVRRNIVVLFAILQLVGLSAVLTISLTGLPKLRISENPERPVPVRVLGKAILGAGIAVPVGLLISTAGILIASTVKVSQPRPLKAKHSRACSPLCIGCLSCHGSTARGESEPSRSPRPRHPPRCSWSVLCLCDKPAFNDSAQIARPTPLSGPGKPSARAANNPNT